MPVAAPKPCIHPGCGKLVRDGTNRCEAHRREVRVEFDRSRGTSAERGYGYQWQKAREGFLRKHPLCVMCQREGMVVAAAVVDHIKPHRGDKLLFWDSANWQPLCKWHHDSTKQAEERRGGDCPPAGGLGRHGRGV